MFFKEETMDASSLKQWGRGTVMNLEIDDTRLPNTKEDNRSGY